jgi:hypothetical protein
MLLDLSTSVKPSDNACAFSNPSEIIDTMIELRVQLFELEKQIQALQPAFFAACLALNTDKIQRDRAIITRRLTPAQWTYSAEILDQEALLKQLKQLFQQNYEPSSGRNVTWAIKLLLAQTQARSMSSLGLT